MSLRSRQDEAELLRLVHALDPKTTALYSTSGRLAHYRGLAQELSQRFHDADLTLAGFLHGVPLDAVRTMPDLPRRTMIVLDDWHSLRRLSSENDDIAASAYTGGAEALALCVHDCLSAVDPQGQLLRWSRAFHRSPAPPPLDLAKANEHERPRLLRLRRVVAPLARAWGFQAEAAALDDIAQLRLDRTLSRKLLAFVLKAGRSRHGCRHHIQEVQTVLARAGWSKEARWEWRHLGSIARKLSDYSDSEWPRALFRCGFVTVLCKDDEDCYRSLHRIHRVVRHRRGRVVDYVGSPSPAGYRAIHTVLLVQDHRQAPLSIAVRLLPVGLDARRHALVDRERLGSLHVSREQGGEPHIRVFTPTGEQRRLPIGATVLDLAYEIHQDFVALADHAMLDRGREVDLLHPLQDGDEVKLVMGEEPRALPEGWESRVLLGNASRLRSAYTRSWRALLAKEGLRQLVRRLGRLEVDDRLVRVLTEMAIAELDRENHSETSQSPDWWLVRVGASMGKLHAPEDIVHGGVDERQVHRLVTIVQEKADRLVRVYEGTEVNGPDALHGQMERVLWCPVCAPGERETELTVTVTHQLEDPVLVVHRRGDRCAEGGMPLNLEDRLSLDQFFVLETSDELGVALQVLDVFRHEGVDVVEVVGRRLGPRWGVFRLEVDPIDRATIEQVSQSLDALENVYAVSSPLDPGPSLLEVALPPRQAAHRGAFFRPVPFVAGPIAVEDHLFYGREAELTALSALLQQLRAANAGGGMMAFVNAPLRMGKTSLVRRFELLIRRQPELVAMPVYVKATVNQSWPAFRTALEQALAGASAEALRLWGQEPAELFADGLEAGLEALTQLPNRPSVVLIVDEVHRLFGNVSQHAKARRELLAFRDFVERTPRLLVLWTGPSHGPRSFHHEITNLLLSSQPIPVLPFSEAEAVAMLEARKMALYQTITIDKKLARHLHRITGGEPFWLANIAHHMWMRSTRSGVSSVRFDNTLAATAKRDLLERHELFATRVEPRRPDRFQAATWRVATALAELQGNRFKGRWGLTADELAERMAAAGAPPYLSPLEVAKALETLQDRGAVLLANIDPLRWRLTFPLLAEYLVLNKQRASQRPPCFD